MSGFTTVYSGAVGVSPGTQRQSSVGFQDDVRDDEERRKYLTAKYGQHQMKLIRKRLAVEDWIDTELKKLYNVVSKNQDPCLWCLAARFVFCNVDIYSRSNNDKAERSECVLWKSTEV